MSVENFIGPLALQIIRELQANSTTYFLPLESEQHKAANELLMYGFIIDFDPAEIGDNPERGAFYRLTDLGHAYDAP